MDSVTRLDSQSRDRVVVCGSHGGQYSARMALAHRVRGAVFHDAGVGRDGAGVSGLQLLQEQGVPAGAVRSDTALIGDGHGVLSTGVLGHVNGVAHDLGCRVGMSVVAATALMARAPSATGRVAASAPASRTLILGGPRPVWALDSASLVEPRDANAVVVTGSHGQLLRDTPGYALPARVAAAVFNDAGIPSTGPGGRLDLLGAEGVPAVYAAASSARIGDGMSTYRDGVISRANGPAERFGARVGMPVRVFIRLLIEADGATNAPVLAMLPHAARTAPPRGTSTTIEERMNHIGVVAGETAQETTEPPLLKDEGLALYRQMQLMRRFEESVLELMGAEPNEIRGPVHPYIGQEAVAAGVCAALELTDKIISTHRGHGHCIGKGARVDRMMAELFGRRTGYCKGKGGSMHIADFDIGMLGANGIVAAGLPIAAGAALAESIAGTSNVVACMFGDGAAAAGPMHETLNIAALSRLPMVFVCENNGWSVNTETGTAFAPQHIADLAAPFGIPSRRVDGNDVVAVRAAARWAVDMGRRGKGPVLLEVRTFRLSGHAFRGPVTPDPRDPLLIGEWLARDPIDRLGQLLEAQGTVNARELVDVRTSVDEELADAIDFARNSPYPHLSEALEDVFA